MDKPKLKPEHMLMEAIGFDEEDLEANHLGVLSERQRDRLRAGERFWIMIAVIGLIRWLAWN